ncbi:hypothetical protein LOC68_10025 [Blastopirellula sp. JC732]|uniref:carbonic anhydrase n=1 Tax=Blastopirellula sediminis TaxID=2894196 RepID=A0A9X1SGI6_9BACT|nr:carbonic anhydrase [Blastopirellula sediminis]MCC9608487.1 hypothetical protein [Blastopirellula sediminis]MCC9628736.1 hypothetical protein [Blastopirellula sediminis]
MILLDKSLHQFAPQYFGTAFDIQQSLDDDVCDILMIACSCHGSAPDEVSIAGPERIFTLQHLAATVPAATEESPTSAADDLAYAFQYFDFKHVILCGHMGCNVIRRWAQPDQNDSRGLQKKFQQTTASVVDQTYPTRLDHERQRLLICEHLLCQLENLLTHDFVLDRLETGELRLHGWLVDEMTARIRAYDAVHGRFVPIEKLRRESLAQS